MLDPNDGAHATTQQSNPPVACGCLVAGLRRDGSSSGDRVCLNIRDDTIAGSDSTAGIGLRLQSGANVFGVNGMSATATPGVEAYVSGRNPLSALGTELLAATTCFSSCVLP